MKLKNYLLAGTALVALSFMAACSEDETIQNENNTENPGAKFIVSTAGVGANHAPI